MALCTRTSHVLSSFQMLPIVCKKFSYEQRQLYSKSGVRKSVEKIAFQIKCLEIQHARMIRQEPVSTLVRLVGLSPVCFNKMETFPKCLSGNLAQVTEIKIIKQNMFSYIGFMDTQICKHLEAEPHINANYDRFRGKTAAKDAKFLMCEPTHIVFWRCSTGANKQDCPDLGGRMSLFCQAFSCLPPYIIWGQPNQLGEALKYRKSCAVLIVGTCLLQQRVWWPLWLTHLLGTWAITARSRSLSGQGLVLQLRLDSCEHCSIRRSVL